jgi:hypothetical protein
MISGNNVWYDDLLVVNIVPAESKVKPNHTMESGYHQW